VNSAERHKQADDEDDSTPDEHDSEMRSREVDYPLGPRLRREPLRTVASCSRLPNPRVLLVLPKSNNRINGSRFDRRQTAGHQGGGCQTTSDQGDGYRILRLDSIQHAAHDATNTERRHYANADTKEDVNHRLSDDHERDSSRPSANGDAHRRLPGAA
jgi:hypothetical protein